ncbi:MAG: zf-TFIIB domain-containing protein [Ilumatobacteraceae bacterium]
MKCPIDTTVDLVMTDRQGIEIDYCPTCRGVWLDRGELDKIIERAAPPIAAPPVTAPPVAAPPVAAPAPQFPQPAPRRYDDDSDGYERPGYKKKKRSSMLGDLFDF